MTIKHYKPKPVNLKGDFYAVEETNWVPINKNGEVWDVVSGSKSYTSTLGYRHYRGFPVHRIVALTFLECPGDPKDFHVNHKNGIKSDNRLENLEWATARENVIHAYKTGLRPDNRKVCIKNLETGKITTFNSLQECARYFKVNGGTVFGYLNRPVVRPFMIKYDMKYEDFDWHNLTKEDIIPIIEKGVSKLVYAESIEPKKRRSIIFRDAKMAADVFKVSRLVIQWYLGFNGANSSNEWNGFRWFYFRDYTNGRKMTNRLIKKSELFLEPVKFNLNPPERKPSKLKVTELKTGESQIYDSLQVYCNLKNISKNGMESRLKRNAYLLDGYFYEYLNKTNKTSETIEKIKNKSFIDKSKIPNLIRQKLP